MTAARRPAQGDIWWVTLDPVVGREQAGRRPALVLSADAFQNMQGDLIVVAPMSRRIRSYAFHVPVMPAESGLPDPGAIMCDQIRTLSTRRLLDTRPAGRVSHETMRTIEDIIQHLFNLP
ncbi:MAG TPA: type II toxin-antitoxin system PemK/MazF family toxin [Thermomicrobiales bacterium]|nr:type II toxin-antitoxin system PemK/MazF family toxin [Thermomicrobiales bacterium]